MTRLRTSSFELETETIEEGVGELTVEEKYAEVKTLIAIGKEKGFLLYDEIYETLPAADFSREVLERASGLELEPLPECGWSDWGTPERVVASLRGTSEFARFEQRLRSRGEGAQRAPD